MHVLLCISLRRALPVQNPGIQAIACLWKPAFTTAPHEARSAHTLAPLVALLRCRIALLSSPPRLRPVPPSPPGTQPEGGEGQAWLLPVLEQEARWRRRGHELKRDAALASWPLAMPRERRCGPSSRPRRQTALDRRPSSHAALTPLHHHISHTQFDSSHDLLLLHTSCFTLAHARVDAEPAAPRAASTCCAQTAHPRRLPATDIANSRGMHLQPGARCPAACRGWGGHAKFDKTETPHSNLSQ